MKKWRDRTSHQKRVQVSRNGVTHCTVSLAGCLPGLRDEKVAATLIECFSDAKVRFGCCLHGFSIQDNHLHILLIAKSSRCMSRWMQGFLIRAAKALNV